ncbi:MAG: MFS transporter, partial [Puniceicoccales bacterium]|nr:MFS transporter [Puniceicoccales bacterium]
KHFQDYLKLSRSQSAWVQFAHYLGYFLIALPAGALCRKLGYKGGILTGLAVVALGAFWFIPATYIGAFWSFLLGVCVIAMGLTFLETIANPYTTVLGHKDLASARINFAQSCNGIGFMLGPIIGGMFFYASDDVSKNQETLYVPYLAVGIIVVILAVIFSFAKIPDLQTEDAYNIDADENDAVLSAKFLNKRGVTGLAMGLLGGALTGGGYFAYEMSLDVAARMGTWELSVSVALCLIGSTLLGFIIGNYLELWKHLHVAGGVFSQFLYVAAQAGIFSFFINYIVADMPPVSKGFSDLLQSFRNIFPGDGQVILSQPDGLNFINEAGATMLQGWVAFGLLVLGRFVGGFVLKKISPHKVLGIYGVINAILMVIVFLQLGWISVVAVFASFFFMSIMFPTIFALSIFGLGKKAKLASSFLVMAIMGGAIMPKLMGWFSDHYGHVDFQNGIGHYGRIMDATAEHVNHNLMSPGFIVPLFCFAIISLYGFSWAKLSKTEGAIKIDTSKGH